MTSKTWLWMGALVLAMPLSVQAQAVRGVTANEILLGMHTDLSGVAASFGVPVANAFRMRIDEINAAGGINGRKIKLLVEDTQYQVPKAVQAGTKLINNDGVFAIIGAAGTPMNNALLPLQAKANVPNLFPISWAASMSEPVSPLKFGIYQPYPDQARAGVKYMVEQKKKKAVCAMYQDTDFGRDVLVGAISQLKDMNMALVTSVNHRPTETDFSAGLTKLREAKCDLIVMGSIVRDTIVPYSTARKMGWTDVDFIGTSASYDLTVSSAQGGATEGYYATGFFDPPYRDTASPAVAKWFDDYKARYNTDPAIQAAIGQVIMDIVTKALQNAGKDLTVKSFVAALENTKDYRDMFNGPVQSITPTRHYTASSSVLYMVHNGRWQRVGESAIQKP